MIGFAVRRTMMYADCANAIRIGARPNHPPERKAVISLLPAKAGHFAELGRIMKKNVENLPLRGAFVVALPMKIGGGSGAPLRAIAILP